MTLSPTSLQYGLEKGIAKMFDDQPPRMIDNVKKKIVDSDLDFGDYDSTTVELVLSRFYHKNRDTGIFPVMYNGSYNKTLMHWVNCVIIPATLCQSRLDAGVSDIDMHDILDI